MKPEPSKPCPTLTAVGCGTVGAAGVCHPYENRKFSTYELKRLASFPDDFILCGTYEEQCERIGRAVPPLMMKAIASRIYEGILK